MSQAVVSKGKQTGSGWEQIKPSSLFFSFVEPSPLTFSLQSVNRNPYFLLVWDSLCSKPFSSHCCSIRLELLRKPKAIPTSTFLFYYIIFSGINSLLLFFWPEPHGPNPHHRSQIMQSSSPNFYCQIKGNSVLLYPFKVLIFPDFYSLRSSALGINENSTLKSMELADWHVDEVTDLKDTFKLQEVNEHPVDYESENVRIIIWGYSYGLLDLFFPFFFF